MIFEPLICLVQTVHLSCNDTNTVFKWTKTRFHMTNVTLEFHRVHPQRFLSLWYVWHKPCTYLMLRSALSPNVSKEVPLEPCHLAVPFGASKTIPEPIICSAQIVLLSCTDTNTISEQTKTRFHMTHVT
jgi:hypothetical protein